MLVALMESSAEPTFASTKVICETGATLQISESMYVPNNIF